jgi:hypothetical protein
MARGNTSSYQNNLAQSAGNGPAAGVSRTSGLAPSGSGGVALPVGGTSTGNDLFSTIFPVNAGNPSFAVPKSPGVLDSPPGLFPLTGGPVNTNNPSFSVPAASGAPQRPGGGSLFSRFRGFSPFRY